MKMLQFISIQSESEIPIFCFQLLHLLLQFGLLSLFRLVIFVLFIVGASQGQTQRNSIHFELVGQISHQKAFVGWVEEIFGVDEEDEMRRSDSCLNHVVQSESMTLVVLRNVLKLLKIIKPIIQQSRRDPHVPLIIGDYYLVHHLFQTRVHLCANKNQRISMQLSQMLFYLFSQVIFSLIAERLFDCFPLIDSNDQRSSFFHDLLDEGEIVNHKGRKGIHHINNHMSLVNMDHRANLDLPQVFFIILFYPGGVQTSSIDQFDLPVFVLDLGADAVSSGMRHIRNHHFILSYNFVDQSRFSNIRPANHANLYGVLHFNILNLSPSAIRKSLLGSHKELLIIVLIKVFIILRARIYLPEIVLPLLYLELFTQVVLLYIFLQLLNQILESLDPLSSSFLKGLPYFLRDPIIDEVQKLQNSSAFLRRYCKHIRNSQF